MNNTKRRVAKLSDNESRDQLVQHHLGLVYYVAKRMTRITAAGATFGEMVSSGTLGLIRAVDAFDPSLGLAFSTYAAVRIRGAILDDLRQCDTVPRSLRSKTRRLRAGERALTYALGRQPNEQEVAQHMNLDTSTLWKWRADIHQTTVVSLDQPVSDEDASTMTLGDLLVDAQSEDAGPMVALQREEQALLLRNAILQLKEQQRVVLSLYYYEGLTLAQIGTALRLTQSRASQIRAAALIKLREACVGMQGAIT